MWEFFIVGVNIYLLEVCGYMKFIQRNFSKSQWEQIAKVAKPFLKGIEEIFKKEPMFKDLVYTHMPTMYDTAKYQGYIEKKNGGKIYLAQIGDSQSGIRAKKNTANYIIEDNLYYGVLATKPGLFSKSKPVMLYFRYSLELHAYDKNPEVLKELMKNYQKPQGFELGGADYKEIRQEKVRNCALYLAENQNGYQIYIDYAVLIDGPWAHDASLKGWDNKVMSEQEALALMSNPSNPVVKFLKNFVVESGLLINAVQQAFVKVRG